MHVHGLGYDGAGDVLYVATHTGLFELLPGSDRATRIGDSRQDTMGFTLVTPQLFLGSGHPDIREQLPPHLGLVRSTDRGRSWQPVSLLGEADFHVLEAARSFVYGFDSQTGALRVSRDRGRSWETRSVPEPLVDLAVAPDDPRHLLASGQSVLFESRDGGAAWSVVASGLAGHLAWPDGGRPYLVDDAGVVMTLPRRGRWQRRGRLGGAPAAFLAVDERTLFAALHDGTILRSTDRGATWRVKARP